MTAYRHSQTPNFKPKSLSRNDLASLFRPSERADSTNQRTNEINHLRARFERSGARSPACEYRTSRPAPMPSNHGRKPVIGYSRNWPILAAFPYGAGTLIPKIGA